MAAALRITDVEGIHCVIYPAWRRISENFRQNSYAGYLAIVRILVGYHFLEVGLPKVARGFYTGESLPGQLADATLDPLGWHRAFIYRCGGCEPGAVQLSGGVRGGRHWPFAVDGVLGTRGVTVRGIPQFQYSLRHCHPQRDGVQIRLNRLYIFLHLLFVFAAAGRSLGLDGWLKKKFPRCWLF